MKAGTAYHCYCSKEELDAMRADQQARKEKPRYDGRCRHGKGLGPSSGRQPVVRFANPEDGRVVLPSAALLTTLGNRHTLFR